MSKAREFLKNEKKASSSSSSMAKIGEWVRKVITFSTTSGLEWGTWTYKHSRTIGWWIVTTGMITALPLIFEIKRELAVEEIERLQVNAALAEGRTPQELANNGLSSAVEPKVLK